MRTSIANRRRIGFETLERRSLLAAGILELDLTIPVARSGAVSFEGTISLGANLVFLSPSDLSDLSVTDPSISGSGEISGTANNLSVDGTYNVPPQTPQLQFLTQSDGSLTFQTQVTGSVELTVGATQSTSENFVINVFGSIDDVDRDIVGSIDVQFQTPGFQDNFTVPFDLPQSFSPFEFPDASLAAISDRVFQDQNNNGVFDSSEPGVPQVILGLLDRSGENDELLEVAVTDASGHYSFYNLPDGPFAIEVRSLPNQLDIGRFDVGDDDTIDSDIRSRTGVSKTIELSEAEHLRTLDIALREVQFEWNNPNDPYDVTDNGTVSADDALRILNVVVRNGGEVTLASNRPLGSEFFDVNSDQVASPGDALRVINQVARSQTVGVVPPLSQSDQEQDEEELTTDPQLF